MSHLQDTLLWGNLALSGLTRAQFLTFEPALSSMRCGQSEEKQAQEEEARGKTESGGRAQRFAANHKTQASQNGAEKERVQSQGEA